MADMVTVYTVQMRRDTGRYDKVYSRAGNQGHKDDTLQLIQ